MHTESSKTSAGSTPAITGGLQAAHDVTGELAKARGGKTSVSRDKLAFEEFQIRRCPQQGCQMGLCIQHDRLSVNVPLARVEGQWIVVLVGFAVWDGCGVWVGGICGLTRFSWGFCFGFCFGFSGPAPCLLWYVLGFS